MKKCKSCQTDIDLKATKCPHCQADQRGWFRRHPILTGIFGLVVFFIVIGAIGSNGSKNTTPASNTTTNATQPTSSVSIPTTEVPVETVTTTPITPTAPSTSKKSDVPTEYKSALAQATTYANTMHLSKQGVYDQLVSEYGGKFSPEAAQYAINNVKADWNANALAQAKTYQDTMHLSPTAVRDQLVSEYGGKFTAAEADYAIQHLND